MTRFPRRDLVIFQGPFLHVPHPLRADPVVDQFGVVDRAQVAPQQRVGVPDLSEQGRIVDDLGGPDDAGLVVVFVQVAELRPRVGLDLCRLAVAPEVGDMNAEAVGLDRQDGPDPGLVAVDGRQGR